ncbi:DUF4249 domain-containing protein [Adhaeribacter terreus]|uniref:DUF4249 domain-containing protein n=1 Tax=Adhaeribacter terreus TaxID=529703 RepID=A0ABW0EG70_9BACT
MLRLNRLFTFILIAFSVAFSGCDMDKEIDLNLPEFESQITVECYLEPGKPYRATITESTSYFGRPEPILVPDATVIITHNGKADTLQFKPGYDREVRKIYTHFSETVVQGNPGETYSLEVFDSRGRRVTGFTRFLPVVPLDSIEWTSNEERSISLLAKFTDNGSEADFYRFTVHQDSLSDQKRTHDFYSNDRLYNGQKYAFGTSYRFSPDDTVFVTLYHLEPQYYEFLNTMDDAQDANGNPFAQPIALKSTVQGGIGVFTTLSFDRKRVVLK